MHETISDYLDAAREQLGSDRAIGRALNVSSSVVNFWRTKRSLPSDHQMVHLATLIGADDVAALAQLNLWRATSPDARARYSKLLDLARAATAGATARVFPFAIALMGACTLREQIHLNSLVNCIL